MSVELTDIIASLAGLAAAVVMLRVWTPQGGHEAAERLRADREETTDGPDLTTTGGAGSGAAPTRTVEQAPAAAETRLTPAAGSLMAFFPYLLIIVVFSLAKLWDPVKNGLAATDIKIRWPGLDGNVLSAAGKPVTSTVYNFQWFSSPGTLLLICGIITALVYRVAAGPGLRGSWSRPRSSCATRSSPSRACSPWPTS